MILNELGIAEVRALLDAGEVSPLDVAESVVSAIDSHEADLHAFIDIYRDDLLAGAREMTQTGAHKGLPLGGIPVAVKDNICIAGRRTTCASKILADFNSPFSATVVERLAAAGALVVGKTNLDEFAMGSSTENSAFGATRNPWDTKRAPGGSSGGAAAAVSAHMAFAALGSDTGGSIRQPASFCGVVGLKPTYGRVSRYGLVAFASSLDQIGPLTRSVNDAATVLGCLAGRDPRDATSISAKVPDFCTGLDRGLDGLRVGVPWSFTGNHVDAAVSDSFERVASLITEAGGIVCDIAMPHADNAVETYYIIATAEASANLARYDGVKYGHRSQSAGNLDDMYTHTRSEGFGAEVKRRILLGTYVLSAGYYDAYYHQAQKVRSLVIRDFDDAFAKCDLVMLPTAPTPAFLLGDRIEDPIQMYASDTFTIPASLAGLPAISIPSGLADGRLPVGVQLIGRALAENTVLRAAHGIERAVSFGEHPFA